MTWILWALLLLSHGAVSRWAQTGIRSALALTFADALLIAIGLITVDELQGMGSVDVLRIGLFFMAFGTAGRQLMNGVLARHAMAAPAPRLRR